MEMYWDLGKTVGVTMTLFVPKECQGKDGKFCFKRTS